MLVEGHRLIVALPEVASALNQTMLSSDRMLRTTTMDESELSFDFERTLQPVSPVRRTNNSQEVMAFLDLKSAVKSVMELVNLAVPG